jgi:hypothetical protein
VVEEAEEAGGAGAEEIIIEPTPWWKEGTFMQRAFTALRR